MKAGFTGTQKGMTDPQKRTVAAILIYAQSTSEVHHGDCLGADSDFHDICTDFCYSIVGHIPEFDSKRAFRSFTSEKKPLPYLVRNKNIVNETDYMIATPGEFKEQLRSGTWSTIRYAKKQKKPLFIVYPDGSVETHNHGPKKQQSTEKLDI